MRIEVRASSDPDRVAWSARNALQEPAEGALFVAHLSTVRLNDDSVTVTPPSDTSTARDLGFVDRTVAPAELPVPAWLPDGMVAHRDGEQRVPGTDRLALVRTWTNGRSWIEVTGTRGWDGDHLFTRGWDGDHLFGAVGSLVRPIASAIGTVYASEDGRSIALHGDGIDLVVTGSVDEAELRRVVESLGVTAVPVPPAWPESGSTTVDELERDGVAALVPVGDGPVVSSGASVAIATRGDRIEVAVAGPGARGAHLVELPGTVTLPAEDPDARSVDVRGVSGRWSPTLGELAWVERGHLLVLSTDSLSVAELVALAGDLRWTA
jgi:hypothetical protein